MMLLPTLQRCWPFPDLVVAVLALLSEGCRSPPGKLLLAAEIIVNIISIVIMISLFSLSQYCSALQ